MRNADSLFLGVDLHTESVVQGLVTRSRGRLVSILMHAGWWTDGGQLGACASAPAGHSADQTVASQEPWTKPRKMLGWNSRWHCHSTHSGTHHVTPCGAGKYRIFRESCFSHLSLYIVFNLETMWFRQLHIICCLLLRSDKDFICNQFFTFKNYNTMHNRKAWKAHIIDWIFL